MSIILFFQIHLNAYRSTQHTNSLTKSKLVKNTQLSREIMLHAENGDKTQLKKML